MALILYWLSFCNIFLMSSFAPVETLPHSLPFKPNNTWEYKFLVFNVVFNFLLTFAVKGRVPTEE